LSENKMFISGYAKLPQGITANKLYDVIAIGLLVDKETGKILDADCSLVTRVAQSFVRELLIGESLNNFEKIEDKLKRQYFGSAKKALISACKICNEKYIQIIENRYCDD